MVADGDVRNVHACDVSRGREHVRRPEDRTMSLALTAQAEHGVELFDYFVEARGRARAPIACVNDRVLLTNAGATRLLRPDDRHALWMWSQRAIVEDDTTPRPL